MTNDHIDFETLSAYADRELKAVGLARVEQHLATCNSCTATLTRLRGVVAAAGALPRTVDAPADAWTGIQSRLGSRFPVPRPGQWWHNGWLAAAAAVILVVGTALLTRGAGRAKGREPSTAVASSATPVALASVDRRFEPTLAELRDVLESQRATLAPSTARTLEHSIAVIDSAIAEARSALAADPSSASLADMLSGYYQRKIDFLKRATTISSSL